MTPLPIHNRFIEIPAGRFSMGSNINDSDASPNEMPQHFKSLQTFYISRYPITNTEYLAFTEKQKYVKPPHWSEPSILSNQGDHPVVNVSFKDVQAYCHWLSRENDHLFRLPTEEEWEKAARGNKSELRYPWGNEWSQSYCNTKESGYSTTTPVTKYDQENIYGIADLVGNVWEWTSSWYQAYPYNTSFSQNYGETHRVIRGGSYHNSNPAARISERGRYKPSIFRPYVGFRIVTEQKPESHHPSTSKSLNLNILRQDIETRFNVDELKHLIADLGLNYDEFPGGRSKIVFELVEYCKRRDWIDKLVQIAEKRRPTANWRQRSIK